MALVAAVVASTISCSAKDPSAGDTGTASSGNSGRKDAGGVDASSTIPNDGSAHDDGSSQDDGSTGLDNDANDSALLGEGGDADAYVVGPPVCPSGSAWSTVVRVPSIASNGFDRFGGIAPDELTVAWTTAAGAIFVADRASTTAPFDVPVQLNPGTLLVANDRVALPDNLDLIATLADRHSFVKFVRASVTDPWTPSRNDEFKYIAATIFESGGAFASPVASAYSRSFFYLMTNGPMSLPALYESTWSTAMHAWTMGKPLPNSDFVITAAALVRRPTGISSDQRTLFFFDEIGAKERAAWRSTPWAPFDVFVDLPLLPEAAPTDDCLTVYFHGTDSTGQGLFTGKLP